MFLTATPLLGVYPPGRPSLQVQRHQPIPALCAGTGHGLDTRVLARPPRPHSPQGLQYDEMKAGGGGQMVFLCESFVLLPLFRTLTEMSLT